MVDGKTILVATDAGEGDLMVIALGRYLGESGTGLDGDVLGVETVSDAVGVAGLTAAGAFGGFGLHGILPIGLRNEW